VACVSVVTQNVCVKLRNITDVAAIN